MLLKFSLFIICFVLILFQSNCTSPQQRAEQVAFADACPKYGFFTEGEIKKLLPTSIDDASSFYLIDEANENSIGRSYIGVKDYRVAIKTSSGKIVHRNAVDLSQGLDVDNQAKHNTLQKDLQEICGKDAQQFAITKYEQVEESKRKVDAIKNSPTWKKALSQSAEFDLGDKGKQLLLAFLNSKDNDVLNNYYYKGNPSEETEDRKIWKDIQKSKYIYIKKDNSEKNTYFYSKDYDVKSQTFPVYFEQGVSFGSSGFIQGSGIYIPRILSETIPIKISPELATKIGKKEIVYNLDVIFTYTTENSNHSYFYANDNGLEIVLNEEKANLVRRADPFTFRSLSKRSGKGKTIQLKPLYYIFSIPEEDVLVTNVR